MTHPDAQFEDADKRLARVKADLADLKAGRKRFFSWTEFVFGLGVVAALLRNLERGR